MPDTSTVHFDVALTNVSIAYRNKAFVASQISPQVLVRKQSDRYFIHDSGRDSFRSTADGRAPGTEASEVDFALSSDSYYCDDHALESAIPDEERDNSDSPLMPEIDRVEFLSDKILLNAEINLAAKLRDSSAIPYLDLSSGSKEWDNNSNDPVANIETAKQAILDAVQVLPNTLVLPFAVYTALRNNTNITDRVKYSNLGVVGTDTLAELFDVERVLVARAVQNIAPRGQAPDMEPVWGNDALLLHVPERVSLKSVAPSLSFVWSQAAGSSHGHSVQTWREERRKATMVRVQKYYDQNLLQVWCVRIIFSTIPVLRWIEHFPCSLTSIKSTICEIAAFKPSRSSSSGLSATWARSACVIFRRNSIPSSPLDLAGSFRSSHSSSVGSITNK